MTGKTKLLIAIVVAIGSISVVTVLANTIYLPVTIKSPTSTPTLTFTPTATATRTPSVTATPTRTPTPKPGVIIIDIVYAPVNPLDEYVEIKNTSNNSVDMDGWWIKVESNKDKKYTFPDFTLGGGKTVKVWTKDGQNDASNLFWDTSDVWNNNRDCAYLRDPDVPDPVYVYCYGYDLQVQLPGELIP
jgi:hypothetical protein